MKYVNFRLSERHRKTLDRLTRRHEATKVEVLRKAICLLDLATRGEGEVYHLATLNRDGTVRSVHYLA